MSSVKDFGAVGDGNADDTDAVLHAVRDGGGLVRFPRGTYRLTRTVEIELAKSQSLALEGTGGTARIVMAAPGPAIRIVGTHRGTGDPGSVKPEIWQSERMPTVSNLNIEGMHAEADGLEMVGTMQSILRGLLVRKVRHGIRLFERNRNVIIDACHVYHNTGVGVFLDRVNLHQINITGSHLSYNRLGGLRIVGSEIRNLQITGNDIEYNNHRAHGAEPEPTAEILIDATDDKATVRELTIASNTIQATYSPAGANVRILGQHSDGRPLAGMCAITGNVIGSQEIGVHLHGCRDVVLSGNIIYSGHRRNLLVEQSRNISVGANTFGHNPSYDRKSELANGIRFVECENCNLSGITIQDSESGRHLHKEAPPLERDALIELVKCRRMQVGNCQILDGVPYGIDVSDSSQVSITGNCVSETRERKLTKAPIRWRGQGERNLLAGNTLDGKPAIEGASKVVVRDNF